MKMQRLPNGNLLIPVTCEYGDVIGDGREEIAPDDPRYAEWVPFFGILWEESLSPQQLARWESAQHRAQLSYTTPCPTLLTVSARAASAACMDRLSATMSRHRNITIRQNVTNWPSK